MVKFILNMSKVAPSMMWSETDPPAIDILDARLRAKYYGVEVITYRRHTRYLYTTRKYLPEDPELC
jgi:hypothetical protein